MQLSNIFYKVCIVFLLLKFPDWLSICEISKTTIENCYVKIRYQTDMPAGDLILYIEL